MADEAPTSAEFAAARGFLIVCLGRTGSSHLVALLDSHRDLRCYGEVLNMKHPKAAPEGWLGDADADEPVAHVRSLLEGGSASATGVKLPANSLVEHPAVSDWLREDRGPAVIRLRRRNGLAILLSRRMVRATFVSQSLYGDYGEATVTIEPAEAIAALTEIERSDAELDRLAEGHPTFAIDYGELGSAERLADLQRFLGVEPQRLSSEYERLRRRPFPETVENWDELSEALAGTRFAPLLRDEAG